MTGHSHKDRLEVNCIRDIKSVINFHVARLRNYLLLRNEIFINMFIIGQH
jgi:hypothetical protein